MRACVRTVGDRLAVKGHVEVAADKDLLALEVGLREVADLRSRSRGAVSGRRGASEPARARAASRRVCRGGWLTRTDFFAISTVETRATLEEAILDGMAGE